MIIIIIIIFLSLLMSDFLNAVQGTDYDAPPRQTFHPVQSYVHPPPVLCMTL